jgi:hypothetical protein
VKYLAGGPARVDCGRKPSGLSIRINQILIHLIVNGHFEETNYRKSTFFSILLEAKNGRAQVSPLQLFDRVGVAIGAAPRNVDIQEVEWFIARNECMPCPGRQSQEISPFGEFSPPSIKCAISAGFGQNGGGWSADLNRLTDEFCMPGMKRTELSIWFLGHARMAVHTIRLLPKGFRDESTISCSFAMIVTHKRAEPFPAHHLTRLLAYFATRNQQPVAHPLMIALR